MQKEAMFYTPLKGSDVQCKLCRRNCLIKEGKRGFCRVRENRNGKLYSLVYGKAISYNIDPIEKKPFFNFHPGTTAFSFSTVGCNFSCLQCQNWEISQASPEDCAGIDLPPEEIVKIALKAKCGGIAYTYTEPTIFFEYGYDTMKLAKKKGLYNVYVTNGYMEKEPIDKVKGLLDAANVDVKGNEEFYKKVCGGAEREYVLENIKHMRKNRVHVEIAYLVIPGMNDKDDDFVEIADWAVGVDRDMPLHFTRFYPQYRMMDTPETMVKTVERAREVAMERGVNYVYVGNVPFGNPGENTYCPNCRECVIERRGFAVLYNKLKNGKCPACAKKVAVIS